MIPQTRQGSRAAVLAAESRHLSRALPPSLRRRLLQTTALLEGPLLAAKLRAKAIETKQLGLPRMYPVAQAMIEDLWEHPRMRLSCRTGRQHLGMNPWQAQEQGACQHLPKIQAIVRQVSSR